MAIYFAQEGSKEKYIKIGFSFDPSFRLKNLQGGNPYDINFIGFMDGDLRLEQKLHVQFKKFHLKGEWYKPCDELLNFIENNTTLSLNNDRLAKQEISFLIDKNYLDNKIDLKEIGQGLFLYLFNKLPNANEGNVVFNFYEKSNFIEINYKFFCTGMQKGKKYIGILNRKINKIKRDKIVQEIYENLNIKWKLTEKGREIIKELERIKWKNIK